MQSSLKKLSVVRDPLQLEACRENILRASVLVDLLNRPIDRDPVVDHYSLMQAGIYLEEAINCLDNAR